MHEAKAGETRSETPAPESGAELGEFADQEFVPIQLTVNGRRVRQLVEARLLTDGCSVQTVEGLGSMQAMSPLQQAFQQCHGLQCGFCTPGMLITATDMLANDHPADEAAVREGLSGNLCRCTGYQHIVQAVMQVAMQGDAVASKAAVNAAVNEVQS